MLSRNPSPSGGFAANKFSGGKHSNMASAGGGALLAQGAKMAYDMYKKNHNNKPHHGQNGGGGYGGPYQQQQGGPPPFGGERGRVSDLALLSY